MRVNMVPRDGGNCFRGSAVFNYAGESFGSDNCGSPGIGQPCTRSNLSGSKTFNPEQHHHQRRRDPEDLGRQPVASAARSCRNKVWFNYSFRHLWLDQDQDRRLLRQEPVAVHLRPGLHAARPRRWPHRQQRGTHLVAGQRKDKFSVYHDNQRKYRNHWGIAAHHSARGRRRAGDADQLRQRHEVDADAHQQPAARSRLRYLQPGIHRALSAERDRPRRQGVGRRGDPQLARLQRRRFVEQPPGQRVAEPGRSLLGAAHVHGRGVVCGRLAQLPRRRDADQRRLEAADDVDRRHAADHLQRRPPGVGARCACRPIATTASSATSASYVQDRVVARPRHAEPRPALRPVHRRNARELGAAEPLERGRDVRRVPRRHGRSGRPLHRRGPELEGHLAARRFRDGRVRRRPHRHQGELRALRRRPADRVRQPGEPDRRADRDRHAPVDRPRRQRPAARRRRQHPVQRAAPIRRRRRPSAA